MTFWLQRFQRDEKGAVAFLIALLLPVIMGTAGLVFDLSQSWEVRRQLQNCADSAALAGAQELPDPVFAPARARDYLELFDNGWCLQQDDTSDIQIFDNDLDGSSNAIRVVLSRPRSYTLARFIGFTDTLVGASATAIKGDVLQLTGMQPFSLIVCGPDADGDGLPECPYVGPCPANINQLFIKSYNPLTDAFIYSPLLFGVPFTIKVGGGDPQQSAGNFQAMEIGRSNDFDHHVEYGSDVSAGDCDVFSTATGNRAGPTRAGLFTQNQPNQWWNPNFPEDNKVSRINRDVNHVDSGLPGLWDDVLVNGDGHASPWDCPRVMYVPLVGNMAPKGGGKMDAQVITFTVMFLENTPPSVYNKGYVNATFYNPDSRLFKSLQWDTIGGLDPNGFKPTGVRLIE